MAAVNNYCRQYYLIMDETRDLIKDISISADDDLYSTSKKIAEGPYLVEYYGKIANKEVKEYNLIKTGYNIWYSEKVDEAIKKLLDSTPNSSDLKVKKELKDTYYATQAKEERLVIRFFKDEYIKWQDNLELKREKMNNAQLALEAIKTRNIDLSQLLKNKQQEVN